MPPATDLALAHLIARPSAAARVVAAAFFGRW